MIALIVIYLLLLILVIWLISALKRMAMPIAEAAKNVTFVIPFKNEVNRIQKLISSLNESDFNNQFELILVDDYSTDQTIEIILDSLDLPFRLLKLKETSGKKNAIAYGVQNATHDHVHTLDADVYFASDYLKNISQLASTDLTILPVTLSSNNLFQQLNSIEFQWLQTITFLLAKLKKPMLCNGANLSFSKTAFLETLPQRTDFNQTSGDDVYLLQAIKKNNGKIVSNSSPSCAVSTPAPNSFSSLINQRKRWIKKALNLPGIIAVLLYVTYHCVPLITLYHISESPFWALPLLLKIIAEWLLTGDFSFKQFGLVVLHQAWYIFYGLVLVVSLGFKGSWR